MAEMRIFLDCVGGAPGSETGERPFLVAENADCPDCGQKHDMESCPKCGADIVLGYGLAFGGCGAYKFCEREGCEWFWKQEDHE